MPIIPGAATLGRGFDIFGRLSTQDSLLTQLIDMRTTDRQEELDGVLWDIPRYANVDRDSYRTGSATFFSDRHAFEKHFAAEASIQVNYGLFSAEFNAAYTSDRKVEESSTFAIYDVHDRHFSLSLSDSSFEQIKEYLKPEIEKLPDEFSLENSSKFWRFFSRYGTHITSQVELGGRLFYYAMVKKSFTSDESTVKTQMKAEYGGVFGGSAEASASWSQMDQRWMENRQVNITALGGSSDILQGLVPTKNVNKGELFKKWVESIRKDLNVMRYKLRPISQLLPDEKANALDDAYDAFVSGKVVARSDANDHWTATSYLFSMGRPLVPPEPTQNLPSVQVAVLDAETLKPHHNKRWYISATPTPGRQGRTDKTAQNIKTVDQAYDSMWEELKKYQQSNHLVLVSTANLPAWAVPTNNLALFLRSCGAGKELDDWQKFVRATANPTALNYTLIGYVGAGPGEGFEYIGWPPAPSLRWPDQVTLSAVMIPMRKGSSLRFKPVRGTREVVSLVAV